MTAPASSVRLRESGPHCREWDHFVKVAGGVQFSCGIRKSGKMECWGNNSVGQATAPAGTYTDLSMGQNFGCAIATGGAGKCWGSITTAPTGSFSAVSTNCFLRTDGYIVCAGTGPTPPFTKAKAFSVGNKGHGCLISTSDVVSCWGDNTHNQSTPPTGAFSAIAVDGWHSCGIRPTGWAECWGQNTHGQATAPSGVSVTTVEALNEGNCAIKTVDSSLTCWGRNLYGETVPPKGPFKYLGGASYSHGCAIMKNNVLRCWGLNKYGECAVPAQ
jgi:alpha-tubulin suppressor-like RCC1 family protein